MTEPTGPTSTSTVTTANPSGDHTPDAPQPTESPTAPQLADLATQRRRRPLRGTGAVYQQIAAEIRSSIESGELAPGQAIPSESQMMERYGVSRPTVRNAIASLRAAGLLIVQRGRATTVRPSIAGEPSEQLEFDPTVTRTSAKTGSEFQTWDSQGWANVEDVSRYRTDVGHLAQVLQLASAEPVFVIERQLQHSETGVEVTHRTYLPFATAVDIPSLEADPFRAPADLYKILTGTGHALRWSDRITTAMPAPDEAATLDIPDGVPLLIHTRTTLTGDRPLLHEETHLPGHRTAIALSS